MSSDSPTADPDFYGSADEYLEAMKARRRAMRGQSLKGAGCVVLFWLVVGGVLWAVYAGHGEALIAVGAGAVLLALMIGFSISIFNFGRTEL